MKTATLHMHVHNSLRGASQMIAAMNGKELAKRAAEVIREFAARKGVSPLAIDYSLKLGVHV